MPANDSWAGATVLSGTSGSGSGDLYLATTETGEPDLDPSAALGVGTLWYKFTPSGPGTLTFNPTAGYSFVVEMMTGDVLADLTQQDVEINSAVSAPTPTSVDVYIRIYPQAVLTTGSPFNYTWAFTSTPNELSVILVSDVPQVPGALVVNVGNLTPGDTVDFYIDNSGTSALTEDVPDETSILPDWLILGALEEQLLFVSVPVDETYDAGTHVLKIVGATSGTSVVSFEVENGPLDDTLDDDGTDVVPTVATPVTKWVFRDPVADYTYTWEVNPLTMSTPWADKVITEGHTTANDGQPLEWEGAPKMQTLQLSGTLLTQTQLEAFQHFASINRRIWLIDHYQRGWAVSVEELDAEPRTKGQAQYPWIHDWKMTLFVWRGPVDFS